MAASAPSIDLVRGDVRRARGRSLSWAPSPAGLLTVVLGAGAGLRLWLMLSAGPGFLGYPDAAAYVQTAQWNGTWGLFANAWRPAGFPVFLSALHALVPSLAFVSVVQHLMGLAIAALLYVTVADVARCRWVALLPACVVAFAGSELYLEHTPLSETLYAAFVVTAIWCATRSVTKTGIREFGWLCTAGVLLGCSATVRAIGISAGPVVLVWVLATRPGWHRRLVCVGALVLGMAVPLGSYLFTQHNITGTWGLTRTTGQTLYARTATFADCRDFTPPAGTRALCQQPGAPREGATWYMFNAASPQVRTMGAPPTDPHPGASMAFKPDARLESFALRAIAHQPMAFLSTTLQGLAKYVAPGFGTPTMEEWSARTLTTELHNPQISQRVVQQVARFYPDARTSSPRSLQGPDAYANAARVEGPVTAVLLLLALGCVFLRGRRAKVAALLTATTAALMVAPVVMLFYGARYATPSYGPLAATAALGLDGLITWWATRRTRRTPAL